MSDQDFVNDIYYNYLNFRHPEFIERIFSHSHLHNITEEFNNGLFEISTAGRSVEEREIKLFRYGHGKRNIFFWSQMHGDESTATMALIDLMRFLSSNDHHNDFRRRIKEELTIYILPMLNPDGAEVFQRRNSHQIDLNRDAADPQTPEGKILKNLMHEIKADFAFNLHDQSQKYSAGNCNKTAAISFLAPPFNHDRSVNKSRQSAIKLISWLSVLLSKIIPGHIGKYSDEHEPRAFGDYSQSIGSSTILIESGWWPNDPEKQFIRKLNFIIYLSSLKSIIEYSYKKANTDIYDKLPLNIESFYDFVIRGITVSNNGKSSNVDIALSRTENGNFKIEDIGNLSCLFGYKEIIADNIDIDITKNNIKPGSVMDLSILGI